MFNKYKVMALPQNTFDEWCLSHKLNDDNVENEKQYAFISIIGTKDVLEHYLKEKDTKHYFKNNHDNVLNLEFDDVDHDFEFHGHNAFALSEDQAQEIVEFIERNLDKNIIIHCRAGVSRSCAILQYIITVYPTLFYSEQDVDYNQINKDVYAKLTKHIWQYIHEKLY